MSAPSLCGAIGANTGELLCDVARGITRRISVGGFSIDAADYASAALLETKLSTASQLPKANSGKLFLFPIIEDIVDSSEANREGTLNQGFKTILLEGKPAYTFKMFAGNSLVKALRKFNNQTVRVFEHDANGRMWGTLSGTSVIGCRAKLFVGGAKAATAQNVEEGVVTMVLSILDTYEYFDNAAFVDLSAVNQNNIKALLDVTITEYAAHAAEVFKVKATIKTSQVGVPYDLYEEYQDLLADPAAWTVKSGATYGTTNTIDSVAKNVANKGWDITIDPTEYAAIGADPANKVSIELKAPSVLAGLGISGFEGIPLLTVK